MPDALHILFVDDILCTPGEQKMITGEYGSLRRGDPPVEFHFETAETAPGRYATEPVIKHISKIARLDAVVLDIMFGGRGDRLGLDMLDLIRRGYPTLPVLIMTSLDKSEIDVVEKAMELGANEYLVKMPTLKEFESVLRIYAQPSSADADFAIWGNAARIRKVRSLAARIALGGTASVLITGESGTGKELVARALHRQGPRRHGPFIIKNCAYEKSDLLDSDLFGHERGAFTGAHQKHIGRIERANGGTLFLDEIGSMPRELQGKLLRVLETRRFQRVGGEKDIESEFQLVCATNRSLEGMVNDGSLREDFFYRIGQIEILLPPLRERVEDIPILADLFLRRFLLRGGASYRAERFDPAVLKTFCGYSWRGNVRELRNAVERAVIVCRTSTITGDDLSSESLPMADCTNESGALADAMLPESRSEWAAYRVKQELRTLETALQRADWNATVATKYLFPQVNSPNATYLKRYLKRLQESPWGIDPDDELTRMMGRILDGLSRGKK